MIAVAPGLGMAAIPKLEIYKKKYLRYMKICILLKKEYWNTKTVVEYTTELLIKRGLKNISGIQYLDGPNNISGGVFLSI